MKKFDTNVISTGKYKIGGSNPCYIVAEVGINFDGNFEQAIKLIDVAAAAGCNAVKFQLFTAEQMYPKNAGKYRVANGKKLDILTIVKDAELHPDWILELKTYATSKNLDFFSSVCDEASANILEKIHPSAYKIASYELTHIPLLQHVAKKKAPIIFSCGGSTLEEVAEAVRIIKQEGKEQIVLMHCMAKYPVPLSSANLRIITTLQLAFPDLVIGYSDHTSESVSAPILAVALGAKVIEKHITLNRNLPGPDHLFALEPKELKNMVLAIKDTEKKMKNDYKVKFDRKILGSSERKTYPIEQYVRDFAFRGIFSTKKIKKGERFTRENIAVLRPGEKKSGIHPRYFSLLLDRNHATRNIPAYTGLSWKDILK